MSKMTSGPWEVLKNERGPYRIVGPVWANGSRVVVTDLDGCDSLHANAISQLPELVEALKNTLRALETHLDLESKRTNISRAGICPCETNEVAQALAALAAIGEG